MTNSLHRRIDEHKKALIPGFTAKYRVHLLVDSEEFSDPRYAIEREKQLKWWCRKWKLNLIETVNPEWKDLTYEI
jgi:putative endonuclease